MTEAARRQAPQTSLEHYRPVIALFCIGVGMTIVTLQYFLLPPDWATVLIGLGSVSFPVSVQNGMWVAFTVACGELVVRFLVGNAEQRELQQRYLPEDERTILEVGDLGAIIRTIRKSPNAQRCFLPRLVQRAILQFQSSRSIDQASALLNTSVEMYLHEVDLRYNMLRYLTWFLPSLGFIGTVVGIGRALAFAGDPLHSTDPLLLTEVTQRLAVSFDGTFLALVMAALLVFLMNVAQSREEHALNLAGQYCLDNLINRLYVGSDSQESPS